jgi:hypothetical protein
MNNTSFEAKRQFSIDRARQDFRSRGVIFRQFGTNIFSALLSVDATSLKTPQFASATMGRDQDGEYRLYLFWLENAPSVDGIEIRLDKINSSVIVVESAYDKAENLKASKGSLIMAASWVWSYTNSVWDKLDMINDVSDLKVRLLTKGNPVTQWYPISFYRLDHWMGSKEVMEVRAGPSKVNSTRQP